MSSLGQPFSKICGSSLLARITREWSFHLKVLIFQILTGLLVSRQVLIFLISVWLFLCASNQLVAQTIDYPLTISNQDILDTISTFKTDNPSQSVEIFKSKMPPVVSNETRDKVLKDLPKKIMELQVKNEKLEQNVKALLKPVLALYGREKAYKLVIFKHKAPFTAIDTGTALFISTGFISEAESDDEILGTIAHEVGHEYFIEYSLYTKHLFNLVKTNGKEIALSKKFGDVLGIIELNCDAFSSITLSHLGYDPIAFIDGLERMTKKFQSEPNSFHPKESIRRQVIESVVPVSFVKKDRRRFSKNLKQIKEMIAQTQ